MFEPSIDVLHQAVSEATLLWGGVYQPIFNGSDPEQIKRSASDLGVDVMWALDNASSSKQVAKLAGYQWHGDNEWSPLAPAKDYMSPRLLGPERMLNSASGANWVLPIWESNDPLDDFYRICFGEYDESPQGTSLKQDFAVRSTIVRLDSASLPAGIATWTTPILVTANAIKYTGGSFGPAFAVVNPSDPERLIALWNLRAYGANIFPWPESHEERLVGAARQWLSQLLERDEFNRWRSGDGKPLPPQIEVWMPVNLGDQPQNWESWIPPVPPELLASLLASVGLNPLINSLDGAEQRIHGWRGSHPFNTNFIHRFQNQPKVNEGSTSLCQELMVRRRIGAEHEGI